MRRNRTVDKALQWLDLLIFKTFKQFLSVIGDMSIKVTF